MPHRAVEWPSSVFEALGLTVDPEQTCTKFRDFIWEINTSSIVAAALEGEKWNKGTDIKMIYS